MKKKMLIVSGCTLLLSLSASTASAEIVSMTVNNYSGDSAESASSTDGGDNYYLSANFGVAMLSDFNSTDSNPATSNATIETNRGNVVGAALGYDFGYTRLEGELSYQYNSVEQAITASGAVDLAEAVDSLAFLVNGYWDFTNDTPWTSFISFGLGAVVVNVDDNTRYLGNDYDTVFAYQVGAGIGYVVNNDVTIECRYRYLATTDPQFGDVEGEYETRNFTVGVRYTF